MATNISNPISQANENHTGFLDDFQDDILDYLYNLEPPADNLFWAGNFQTFATSVGEYSKDTISLPNAQFRIKKVSFDSPGLEFGDDNKHTFQQFVKNYKPVTDVKIDFRDDFAHSIKRYHYDWLKYWYHRKHGVFRVGPYGKLRGLDIILFHYAPQESNSNFIQSLPKVKPILAVQLRGMMPTSFSGWNFDTDAPNNEQIFSASYKLNNAPKFLWFDNNNKSHYSDLDNIMNINDKKLYSNKDIILAESSGDRLSAFDQESMTLV